MKFALGIAGVGGVAGAFATANRLLDLHTQKLRETSAESQRTAQQILTFAAIQEGGTARRGVMETAGVAAEFGITDRGIAFDVVQALQSSMGGDFKQGLDAAREVFAASLAGIPRSWRKRLRFNPSPRAADRLSSCARRSSPGRSRAETRQRSPERRPVLLSSRTSNLTSPLPASWRTSSGTSWRRSSRTRASPSLVRRTTNFSGR